jgi:uncharacterized protein with WD repeat
MKSNRIILAGLVLAAFGASALGAARPKFDLRGHRGAIEGLAFHPAGQLIASFSIEPEVRLWSMETGRQVRQMAPSGRTVTRDSLPSMSRRSVEAIGFAPDGSFLAEAAGEGDAGVIRLWDPVSGAPIKVLFTQAHNVRALAISPDGKLIAANMRDGARSDHKIALIDVETGQISGKELRADRLAATMLAFSLDGETLVSAGGRQMHVWDVATRKIRHTIGTHKKTILSIACAPDNEHFASSNADDQVRIWSAKTGKLVREFEHDQDGVRSLAYSLSGRTIATGGADNTIKLWTPGSGKYRETLWGHTGPVTVLEFSPTDAILASGSRDGTIAVWGFEEPAADEADDSEDGKDKD